MPQSLSLATLDCERQILGRSDLRFAALQPPERRKYYPESEMPPFEFENWAVIALGRIANKVQVGDMGLDGRLYPLSAIPTTKPGSFDFMDVWYSIQVKQKDKVGRPDIDAFEAAMVREERMKGSFAAFDYTADALTEISRFFKKTGKVIVPLTVKQILEDEIAMRLV